MINVTFLFTFPLDSAYTLSLCVYACAPVTRVCTCSLCPLIDLTECRRPLLTHEWHVFLFKQLSTQRDSFTHCTQADCLLDAIASLIVFWRYWRALKGHHVEEHSACLWLGGLIIISSLGVVGKAIADLITPTEVGDVSCPLSLSTQFPSLFLFSLVCLRSADARLV